MSLFAATVLDVIAVITIIAQMTVFNLKAIVVMKLNVATAYLASRVSRSSQCCL